MKKNRLTEAKWYLKKEKALDYWNINEHNSKHGQKYYYLDIRPRIKEGHFDLFDDNGIPIRNYGSNVGIQYNPLNVAAYGLGHLDLYNENEEEDSLKTAFSMAEWLISNKVLRQYNDISYYVWQYNFDWIHGLKAPWISGMAQGEIISLFSRLYKITSDERYIAIAKLAYNTFLVPVSAGGVLDDLNGGKFIQESPSKRPSYILNGFIYAIWGVFDLYLVTKEKSIYDFFVELIETLKNNISFYDKAKWSLYDLYDTKFFNVSSITYHNLHIVQLESLYLISGEKIFHEYSIKWTNRTKSLLNRLSALFLKSFHKMIKY